MVQVVALAGTEAYATFFRGPCGGRLMQLQCVVSALLDGQVGGCGLPEHKKAQAAPLMLSTQTPNPGKCQGTLRSTYDRYHRPAACSARVCTE